MNVLIYFATIFWSLFPNLIHVFQGGDNFINKVNETNLVVNGKDFNQTYARYDNIITNLSFEINTEYYTYIDYQVIAPSYTGVVGRLTIVSQHIFIAHNDLLYSDGLFHKISQISLTTNSYNNADLTIYGSSTLPIISTLRSIYIYNVSQMKLNGVKNDNSVLFSDLTNEEIRLQLDLWITEHGDLSFTITKDNTHDSWFNTGFVDKQAERDFLDYLGYFVWLMTPPIMLFITLDLIRRLL